MADHHIETNTRDARAVAIALMPVFLTYSEAVNLISIEVPQSKRGFATLEIAFGAGGAILRDIITALDHCSLLD